MSSTVLSIGWLSLSGSVVALAILALKRLLRRKVSPAFFYYIWIVVLLRLVLPISFPFSGGNVIYENVHTALYSVAESNTEPETNVAGIAQHDTEATVQSMAPTQALETSAAPEGLTLDTWAILFWIWLAGAGACLLCHIIPYMRFAKRIRSTGVAPFEADSVLFEKMRGRRHVTLLQCDGLATPMLIGVFRPCIVIPCGSYVQNGMMKSLEYTLRHELVHERRRDLLFKWVAVCISSFHWFNPAMLLIQREISRACELSCDEAVTNGLSPQDRQRYGETLLDFASGERPAQKAFVTLCENKRQLKERLTAIKKYRKRSAFTAVLSSILALLLAGCAAGLGPAHSGNTGIIMPPATSEIESIAGGEPIDLADNEISHAFLPHLVREAKRIYPYLETADVEPFKLFAAVPFEDGALLLAGTAVSEDYPALYYMIGETVVAVNHDAEYFSSNYAVYKGKTIAYGRMLGEYSPEGFLNTTEVKGYFANGQEAVARSILPDTMSDTAGGYILVADGETC